MKTIALLYHDVVPAGRYSGSGFSGADADIYKLHIDEFQSHLQEIARVVPGVHIGAVGAGEARNRQLLMTFDDGGVSAVQYTADMLERFGWRGHFFITTSRIGNRGFLDETQIRELFRRSHIIGSHSCTHPPRMSHCSRPQLDNEWRKSVDRLTQILGEPVATASVPGGYFSRAVAESAAEAGLRLLFTSEPVTSSYSVDGCTVLGRFSVQHGTPTAWVGALARGDSGPRLQSYLFWNGKKLLKKAGGETWLAVRRKVLARRTAR